MRKLHIALLIPGLPVNYNSFETGSIGGSESAGLYMARALARRGHTVTLFASTQTPGKHDGIVFADIRQWEGYAKNVPHDVNIVQRATHAFGHHLASSLNIAWQHDSAIVKDRDRVNGVLWNLDKMFVLSEYMRRQYIDTININQDVLEVTRNGIDVSQMPRQIKPFEQREKAIVYSSRPERGLDLLLENIFMEILKKDPNIKLYICGYFNPNHNLQPFYDKCEALKRQYGDRVVDVGALNKRDLYKLYNSIRCQCYTTPGKLVYGFAEISCITAMESMACGLPMVTTNYGALKETLRHGRIIDHYPLVKPQQNAAVNPEYSEAFSSAVVDICNKPEVWNAYSGPGVDYARNNLDWSLLAEEWETLFYQWLQAKAGRVAA